MGQVKSFNLIEEPWIICRTDDGTQKLSIRQVFDGSACPLAIVGDSPTQDYAVLRVLLAIFWRAHFHDLAPKLHSRRAQENFEWDEWFLRKREELTESNTDEIVLKYLSQWCHRFDLLDTEAPFMQVAGLHTSKNTTAKVSRIIPEAEDDYFTMRTGPGRETLEFDEAARWLVHVQAYDYSGIKSGLVGDPRVKGGRGYPIGMGWAGRTGGTVVRGRILLETLLLNSTPICISQGTESDQPVWERDPDTVAPQELNVAKPGDSVTLPKGPADLATWQSRRALLFHDGELVTAVLVGNGDRIPDAGKNVFGDPMTPYRYSPNQSKKDSPAYYPQPYDTQRMIWRSLDALIAVEGDPGFDSKLLPPKRPLNLENLARVIDREEVLDLQIVSMSYGPKGSTYGSTVSSSVGMPLDMLKNNKWGRAIRNDVRNSAAVTGKAAKALGVFAGNLHVAAGAEYEFGVDAAEQLFALLEPNFLVGCAGSSRGKWRPRLFTGKILLRTPRWELLRSC